MKRRSLLVGMVGIVLGMALAACGESGSGSGGIIVIEDGATETQIAQTVAALQPAHTLTPTRTPAPTGAPHVIPTLDPALDPDLVVGRVGSDNLTLDKYQTMVRFERFVRLYALAQTVERRGPEQVLDLTRPENQIVASLFATLSESFSFGRQVYRVMTIDSITLQEATRRGLEVDPLQFDARLAQYLNQQVGEGGKLPPGFEADYAKFLDALATYTGMNEEEFRRVVRARVLYSQLKYEISQSRDALPPAGTATVGVEVQDIVVTAEAEASLIANRLKSGETLADIMTALGYQQTGASTSRVVRFSSDELPEEVVAALSRAEADAVMGPFRITAGWYVARVIRPVVDALSPADIDALREQFFLHFIEDKMDDSSYVVDYDNWIEHTPQDPLPRDISPLMRDEYVILPETDPALAELLGGSGVEDPTPTATLTPEPDATASSE